jgi:hypothetical protein
MTLLATVLAPLCCVLFIDGLALNIPATLELVQDWFRQL